MKPESRKTGRRDGRGAAKATTTAAGSHGFTVLEDVSAITERSENLQETLQRIVEVIARRTSTDVCSIYLLEPRVQRLTLEATTGLERSAVGIFQTLASKRTKGVFSASGRCGVEPTPVRLSLASRTHHSRRHPGGGRGPGHAAPGTTAKCLFPLHKAIFGHTFAVWLNWVPTFVGMTLEGGTDGDAKPDSRKHGYAMTD